MSFISKILSLFCCSAFKSSCCESQVNTELDIDGTQTTHNKKELGTIEYTNIASKFKIECGNKTCCFFKIEKY